MERSIQHLILHGSITLIVGFLCGVPFGFAITRKAELSKINAWRVAHSALVLGAIMMFSVAGVMPKTIMSDFWAKILTVCFVISAYAFIVALPYGAAIGERGLRNAPGPARIVFYGNTVAAIGSTLGAAILLAASLTSVLT